MEKISVIIPTYNRADKIMRAINSVLEQTYDNIEVLVIDDGSTDNTQEVLDNIKDDRIHYIRLTENKGPSNARNEGVLHASADIIAFQDSDDYWRANKLEKQMSHWKEHPEYSMIYCKYAYHKGEMTSQVPREGRAGLEGDVFPCILRENTIGAPTMLFRKDCFLEVGGFDTSFQCLEDWEFVLRFAESYMVGYVDEVLVDAYKSEDSVSSRWNSSMETRCYIIAKYREYMLKYGIFDAVVGELFQWAEKEGILKEISQMLKLYLSAV